MLSDGEEVQLLDVREPWEYDYCRIPGSRLIPFGILPLRKDELDRNKPVVIICHHGNRSYHACRFLASQGFQNLINLAGGIDQWSKTVDRTVPTY